MAMQVRPPLHSSSFFQSVRQTNTTTKFTSISSSSSSKSLFRWAPGIMPLQMFRIGQLYIIGVPAEFTTMAGRRLRVEIFIALFSSQSIQQQNSEDQTDQK
jgi:hypothetical protein